MPFSPIPRGVYPSVTQIRPEALAARGIRLVLADLDNTLVRYGPGDPAPEVLAWREGLRTAGVELFLLSNSRKPDRPGRYAKRLDIPYLGHAGKPRTAGFEQAMARMGRTAGQTAMVGDQIFTDILGARRMGILALLVEPIQLAGNPGRYLRYGAEWPFRMWSKRRTKPL